MAKAEIHLFYIDSLKFYVDEMQKSLSQIDEYFCEAELQQIHDRAANETLLKVFGSINCSKTYTSIVFCE